MPFTSHPILSPPCPPTSGTHATTIRYLGLWWVVSLSWAHKLQSKHARQPGMVLLQASLALVRKQLTPKPQTWHALWQRCEADPPRKLGSCRLELFGALCSCLTEPRETTGAAQLTPLQRASESPHTGGLCLVYTIVVSSKAMKHAAGQELGRHHAIVQSPCRR